MPDPTICSTLYFRKSLQLIERELLEATSRAKKKAVSPSAEATGCVKQGQEVMTHR
jgi:hypothetical protein